MKVPIPSDYNSPIDYSKAQERYDEYVRSQNPSHGYTEGAEVPNQPTPEQAAKEAWENHSLNRAISFQHSGIANMSFMRGIETYQASIKNILELEIEEVRSSNSYSPAYAEAKINGLRLAIQRITTAMPPEK